MPSFRSALFVAALSAVSSLAWADNIVVNNSTFSALPAGGAGSTLSFGYGGSGTAWANSPAPQLYQPAVIEASTDDPPPTQTVYTPPPAPASLQSFGYGGVSFGYGGGGTAWANSPAPQQALQPDVGAQFYIQLAKSPVGQANFDPPDPFAPDAPEPSTFALLLAGAAAIFIAMRYRRSHDVFHT